MVDRAIRLLLCATVWAGAAPAFAHHSDAMFDHSKTITVSGTVKDFQWTNPHVWLQVLDSQGHEQGFEAVSPNTMVRTGWRKSSLAAGDKITVTGNPRRDGESGGFLLMVQKADGTTLNLGPPRPANGSKTPAPTP